MKISPRWIDPPVVSIPEELKTGINASELLLEALVQRGIRDPQTASGFLDFHCYSPASPFDLPGMQNAVDRINTALDHTESVLVWGDFDVDGQTATAVLVSGLRTLGADVRYHIPVRGIESHGVRLESLKQVLTPEIRLVLTCDTGITANDAAEYLRNTGVDLIITDHHTLPEILPPAVAVLNPHLLTEEHPLAGLSGVGVAYELIQALFEVHSLSDQAVLLHDLVALGTIADLAPLSGENRFLVQSGIDRMRREPRFCIEKMAETIHFVLDQVTEEQISYYLAPRLNAVGRLEDANPLVDFLLSSDPATVAVMIERMEGLNARRKLLVDQVYQGCLARLEREPDLMDRSILILDHPEWPGGVVGIAASRLVEVTHKPVILLNTASPSLARGSARSIEGIDITAALTANQQYLVTFGGHAMAAGLSLDSTSLDDFRRGMERAISEQSQVSQTTPSLNIDAYCNLGNISTDLITDLDRLAPFGPGNSPLIFAARNLKLINTVGIGRNGDHLQAMVEDETGNAFRILWWQGAGLPLPEGNFDLAYSARLNNFRGQTQIQLEWVDFRPAAESPLAELKKPRRILQWMDYRRVADTLDLLKENSDRSIYLEGKANLPIAGANRLQIQPAKKLVLLTVPPSPEVLSSLVRQVQPEKVFVYGFIPPERNLSTFMSNLAAWLKEHRKQPESQFTLEELAAKFSVTTSVIQTGLEWFTARGKMGVVFPSAGQFCFSKPGEPFPALAITLESSLTRQFDEIAAYQRYYLSASLDSLISTREK